MEHTNQETHVEPTQEMKTYVVIGYYNKDRHTVAPIEATSALHARSIADARGLTGISEIIELPKPALKTKTYIVIGSSNVHKHVEIVIKATSPIHAKSIAFDKGVISIFDIEEFVTPDLSITEGWDHIDF